MSALTCKRGGRSRDHTPPAKPKAYTGDVLPPLAEQGTPRPGGTLVIAMGAEPPSLNYQLDPLDAWGKKINELVASLTLEEKVAVLTGHPGPINAIVFSPDGKTVLTGQRLLRGVAALHETAPQHHVDLVVQRHE